MFKKGEMKHSHYKKGDLGQFGKQLGNFHTKGSVYPLINANDIDLNGARKAGNCLEKHSK